MEELKKRLSQKKRYRTQTPYKFETIQTIPKQKYIINNKNIEYSISLKLPSDKNSIEVECSRVNTKMKFEASIKLEELKEKCNLFHICQNLADVFKIFNNCFNNKKAKIGEETSDSINLILIVPNYIDNIEENICLNLIRTKDKIDSGLKFEKIDNNKLLDNLLRENNNGINLGLDLIQKITDLAQNDIAKDNLINKLICLWDSTIKEIKQIKEDIEMIKKKIGMDQKDDTDKEKDKDNDNENENENDNDNDNDNNNKMEGIINEEVEMEEKEEEELEDEKEDSRFKYNEESEEEEEFEEDTEQIREREKLKNNLRQYRKSRSEIKQSKKNTISYSITTPQKKSKLNSNNISNSNPPPQMSYSKTIIKKSNVKYLGDNNFIVFESINKQIILVFSSIRNTINLFDVDKYEIIKEIPEAHKSQITNFRYARDTNYNRDLLLSIADKIKNIRIWDIKTLNCILNIDQVYSNGFLFSACFLIDEINKKNYVISINYNSEPLKIFSLEGNNLYSQIKDFEHKIYAVDTFFNKLERKYYIILGCETCIMSLNFEEQTLYKTYSDYKSDCLHMYFSINCKDNKVYLIDSDLKGYIRIWDFNTGKMLKKYLLGEKLKLRGICLWDENYVFVGASDKFIKLVDLKNGEVVDNLRCYDNVTTIKKIYSYKFGECLLLQGRSNNGQIKLWKKIN